jgi:hypothetical protein
MMFWTLAGVTVVFGEHESHYIILSETRTPAVVGYSWIDTHLPVLVSSGVGVEIGWKRA